MERVVDGNAFTKYGFTSILENEFDAIMSRRVFIQNSEPSSLFVGL